MDGLTPSLAEKISNTVTAYGYVPIFLSKENFTLAEIADCEIFFGLIPPEYLPQLPELKWFQCSFAGVNRYLNPALFPRPVLFTNASGAYGISIAEFVLCGILMLFRKMPQYMQNQSNCLWRSAGEIRSIYGSKATIVGLGDLGQNIALRLKNLGCFIQGVKRTANYCPACVDKLFTTAEIDQAIKDVDILVLCLPETADTIHLLNEKRIQSLSSKTIVVNVGRGSAIDTAALEKRLRNHTLAGAVLDVVETEPLPPEHTLWSCPNLILTPHTSGDESLPLNNQMVVDIFLNNFHNYIQGKPLAHMVDLNRQY